MTDTTFALCWVPAAMLGVTAFTWVMCRVPPRLGVVAFLAIPVLATPLWWATDAPLFSAVKVYSVCLGAAWVNLLKVADYGERAWPRRIAYGLLAVNILEAVVAGAFQGQWLTAAAGLLLIATQALPAAITVVRRAETSEVRYDLGGPWVAAYVVWNFAFVYGTAPAFAAFALAHLGGPLVAMRGRADRFIEARSFGLALLMIVRMSLPTRPWLATVPSWHEPRLAAGLSLAALAMAAWVVARSWRTRDLAGALGMRWTVLAAAGARLAPVVRPLGPALAAGALYGAWAAVANAGDGMVPALRAAGAQAALSVVTTLTLLLVLEWLFRWPTSRVRGFWLAATATSLLAAALLAAGHTLAGTHHVLLTIAPSVGIGTIFYFGYARRLLRHAG